MKMLLRNFVAGLGLLGLALRLAAEPIPAAVSVPALPAPLVLVNAPTYARLAADGALELGAAGKTNLFIAPDGRFARTNAPMVLFEPAGDFVFSVRVKASLREVYDVAALVLFENEGSWAKLCFENSVEKETTIVSVVTRGLSDDCNSEPVGAGSVYLGIVRRGNEFAFHWSKDGQTWRMARHFSLATTSPLKLGFAVHAVGADGVGARFSEIRYSATTSASVRRFPR